jgi:Ca-activated chloride channel family protein
MVLSAAHADQAPTQSPPQAPSSAPAASTPETTFNVDVSVLTMSVAVTDDKGKSVSGLTKDDFVLLEDGKQRPITGFRAVSESTENRVPFGLGLVLDVSGSMTQDRLDAMRTALEELLTKRLTAADEVYFLEFANAPRLVVPWTSDRKAVMTAIRKIKTRNGTAIYDAIAAALPVSAQGKQKKQVMLVITDGGDTHSTVSRPKLTEMARAAEVLIYALVVDGEEAQTRDTSVIRQAALELAQVSDATGGRTQYLRGFQELENAMGSLGRDLNTQYEISFERSAANDGKFHPIRVGVRRQNVTVRHKLGYLGN